MRESRTYGSGRGACDEIGHEKSDLVIVAMKPANKAKEAHCGSICRGAHVPTATEARVHHVARWDGRSMAASSAGAAGRDASDWGPGTHIV
jgi:hypothetical protein